MSMHLVSPPSALMNMLVSVLRKARFILIELWGKRHATRANRPLRNGTCTRTGQSVLKRDTVGPMKGSDGFVSSNRLFFDWPAIRLAYDAAQTA